MKKLIFLALVLVAFPAVAQRVAGRRCSLPPADQYGNRITISHIDFADASRLTVFRRYLWCSWLEDQAVITSCTSPNLPCEARSACLRSTSYVGCGECWPEWGGCVSPSIGVVAIDPP